MDKYVIKLSKEAVKDQKLLASSNLLKNVEKILSILINNPYAYPPSYEKLKGNLSKYYSRRINSQHRIIYYIDDKERVIKIIRMWTHYDGI